MHHLLVVDENITVQRVIKLAFKDEPIRVVTLPRGRDAFEQIETDPPDIVLADNGDEIAAFLKSRPKLAHIPVVLLKGAFDPAGEGPDEALGCDDVLMKPLQPQTMIDRVKRLLRERKAGRRNTLARLQTTARPAPAAVRGAEEQPGHAPPHLDPNLELGEYFDRLSVAFSLAQSAAPQPPADSWLALPAPGVSPAATPAKRVAAQAGAPTPVARPTPPAVTDDLVDQVTQRVLDRLGDRMVRSTAAELVSRLSKWLIVDAVERTK